MKIVVSNKSKIGQPKLIISNRNNIGRVTFSKIAKVAQAPVFLSQLVDVDTSSQQDGDVLVYNGDTSSYFIQTLPKIDGGIF